MATPIDHAEHGRRAIEVGTPDFGRNGQDEDGFITDATDTVANVLHAVYNMVGAEGVHTVLRRATYHFEAEIQED